MPAKQRALPHIWVIVETQTPRFDLETRWEPIGGPLTRK
jgi:hypothetical protein